MLRPCFAGHFFFCWWRFLLRRAIKKNHAGGKQGSVLQGVTCGRISHKTFLLVFLEGFIIEPPPRCYWLLGLCHQMTRRSFQSSGNKTLHQILWLETLSGTNPVSPPKQMELWTSSVGKLCSIIAVLHRQWSQSCFGRCCGPKSSADTSNKLFFFPANRHTSRVMLLPTNTAVWWCRFLLHISLSIYHTAAGEQDADRAA